MPSFLKPHLTFISLPLLLCACGEQPSQPSAPAPKQLSFEEFKDKLQSIAFRRGTETGYGTVILKDKLIETMGQPARVQQPETDKLLVYYAIANGMLQIEAPASYWNGTDKYTYLDSEPSEHPIVNRLDKEAPKDALGDPDSNSQEYKQILVDWYLETEQNPFTIGGPDEQTGWYHLEKHGKYHHVGVRNKKEKSAFEEAIVDLLASSARTKLNAEISELTKEHREKHTKSVDTECLVVMDMRVY